MKVKLLSYTPNADKLLIFSKKTRLNMSVDNFNELWDINDDEIRDELKYVFNTISSSWEFVDYIFLISGVSRAFCMEKGSRICIKLLKNNGKSLFEYIGTKKIEDIKIGDKVYSYNEKTGEKEWDNVIYTNINMVNDWYIVEFDNGNGITMTSEHPVYVISRVDDPKMNPKWISAKDLRIGDECMQLKYLGIHSRTNLRGKTLEQSYGREKSDRIKQAISESNSRSYIDRFGEDAWNEAEKRTKHFRGKSYEDLYGKEKADELKSLRKEWSDKMAYDPIRIEHAKEGTRYQWKINYEYMLQNTIEAGLKSASSYFGKKSKAEIILDDILNKICPGEFIYNGTGDIGPIGFRLPDFVNINGKKKVIELFGCYWHGCDVCGFEKISGKEYRDSTIYNDYGKFGYDCLIVWEHELKNKELLENRIKTYVCNPGVVLTKIKSITRSNIFRNSYNIETEKNHNFFAYGILTHNTHELVRTRQASYAQQSMRAVNMGDFDYVSTGRCKTDDIASLIYSDAMCNANEYYNRLISIDVDIQDARGVLPTNICTNIMMKINLRSLSNLMNDRLCFRASGEYQEVAKEMKNRVMEVHPWAKPVLQCNCVQYGFCKFRNFKDCPMKIQGFIKDCDSEMLEQEWNKIKLIAQPEVKK